MQVLLVVVELDIWSAAWGAFSNCIISPRFEENDV